MRNIKRKKVMRPGKDATYGRNLLKRRKEIFKKVMRKGVKRKTFQLKESVKEIVEI